MRPLAEFVMRGRKQALLAALLATGTSYFYWIGSAVIALVTLRKGLRQGAIILAWALLPALAQLLWLGDTMPLASIVSVTLAAAALRFSVKWEWALLAITASSFAYATLLAWLAGDLLTPFIQASNELLQGLRTALAEQGGTAPEWLQHLSADKVFAAGLFGGTHGMMTLVSLLLARHWQSMLYNPGGFGNEFRALRFSPAQTLLLLGAMATCMMVEGEGQTKNLITWAAFALLPLLVAGIALVHGVAAIKEWKTGWLIVFHVLWIVSDYVKIFLVLFAAVDSWLGLRERLAARKDTHED
jgi:hypothetical protein